MNGNEVFRFAVRVVPAVTREALEQSGLGVEDLTWLIPHQANQRIIDTIADRLGMVQERIVSTISPRRATRPRHRYRWPWTTCILAGNSSLETSSDSSDSGRA